MYNIYMYVYENYIETENFKYPKYLSRYEF